MSYIPRLNINHASVSASSEETETTSYNMLKITYGVNATDLLATVSTEDGPIWEQAIEARAVEAGTEVMPWRRRVATRIGVQKVMPTDYGEILEHFKTCKRSYYITEAFAATVNFAAGYRIYEDGSLVTQPYLMGLDIAKYLFHFENLQSDWPLAHRNDMYPQPLYSDVDTVHSRAFDNAWGDQALTVRYETAPGVLVYTKGLQRRDRIVKGTRYNRNNISASLQNPLAATGYPLRDFPGSTTSSQVISPLEIPQDSGKVVPYYLGMSTKVFAVSDQTDFILSLGNLTGVPETSKGLKHITESGYVLDSNLKRSYLSPAESLDITDTFEGVLQDCDFGRSHSLDTLVENSQGTYYTDLEQDATRIDEVECNDIGDPQIPEIYYQGSWQSLINDDKLAKQGSLEGNNEADLQRWESDLDIIEGLMARTDVDPLYLFYSHYSDPNYPDYGVRGRRSRTPAEEAIYLETVEPMATYHKQWLESGLTYMSPTYQSLKEICTALMSVLRADRTREAYAVVYRGVTNTVQLSTPVDPLPFEEVQVQVLAAKALTNTDEEWRLVQEILNIHAGTAVFLGEIPIHTDLISNYSWNYPRADLPAMWDLTKVGWEIVASRRQSLYGEAISTKIGIDIGLQRKWIELERLVRPKQVTSREQELQRREAMITELKSALDGTWTPPADFVLQADTDFDNSTRIFLGSGLKSTEVTLDMFIPGSYDAQRMWDLERFVYGFGFVAIDVSTYILYQYLRDKDTGFFKDQYVDGAEVFWDDSSDTDTFKKVRAYAEAYHTLCIKNIGVDYGDQVTSEGLLTPGYDGYGTLASDLEALNVEYESLLSTEVYQQVYAINQHYNLIAYKEHWNPYDHRYPWPFEISRSTKAFQVESGYFSIGTPYPYRSAKGTAHGQQHIRAARPQVSLNSLEPMQMLIDLERQLTLEEYGASGIQTDGRVSFEDLAKYRNVAYVMAPEGATLSTTGPVISVEVLDKS